MNRQERREFYEACGNPQHADRDPLLELGSVVLTGFVVTLILFPIVLVAAGFLFIGFLGSLFKA